MNTWVGLGVFLLGAATGALVTAIALEGRIQRLRAEMESQIAQQKGRPWKRREHCGGVSLTGCVLAA